MSIDKDTDVSPRRQGRKGTTIYWCARCYAKYFAFCYPIKCSQHNEIGVVIIPTYVTLLGFEIKREGSTNTVFGGN